MGKLQGSSWWSLIMRRLSREPRQCDFADMGDTIGLDASLGWEQEQLAAHQKKLAAEAAEHAAPKLGRLSRGSVP